MSLKGKVCLVTGASRGIGKGIALQLGEAGATVYITGRGSSESTSQVGGTLAETAEEIRSRGGKPVPIACDHSKEEEVKKVFDRIEKDDGRLDVLVNNAYSAVGFITRETEASRKFWESPESPGEAWDIVNNVGLRNHYVCSYYAARMMTKVQSGLIVNVSSFGGMSYIFGVPYGVGKCALDRMTADMAVELKKFNVACVTLYPGAVSTEEIQDKLRTSENTEGGKRMRAIFADGETPEFSGKAVAALAADPKVMNKTGKISIVAELAGEYGFTDVDGKARPSMRQLNYLLNRYGLSWLGSVIPNFVKVPGFFMVPRRF